ncbi:MAG: DUF2203 family protein [Planctomycetes bacterium]|nr:DUF2203 family protein [Planctomycetota bacterium]
MDFTKETYEAIVAIVDDRVREIRVTRQDFEALRAVVQELAEAQKVLTQRVDQLTQRVDQLTQRMDQLTQRMDQLTQAVQELTGQVKEQRQQLGVVSERFGFTLEELAADRLPRYLKAKEGWTVEWPAAREYRVDGKRFELDLVAEARKGKRRALLVAEFKSRVTTSDVGSFREKLDHIPELAESTLLPAICGLLISPGAQDEGKRLGVRVLYLRGLA